ncbi:MAG: hypothetical protein SGJ11_12465 [Phycisphaerae bacterium]|nr:hypothetical protein [Phycisphaerae bacterium]
MLLITTATLVAGLITFGPIANAGPAGGASKVQSPPRVERAPHDRSTLEAVRAIRRKHFGTMRDGPTRTEGLERIKSFVNPASLQVLYEQLRAEKTDVVTAMLDHFATLGENGQVALGWVVLHEVDPGIRAAATERITKPATPALNRFLATNLASSDNVVANRAGSLAAAAGAIQLIPTLIATQSSERARTDDKGDLAWIAIQTQKSYIANVVPVLGDNAGAFQPIIGVIGEGTLLRVMDAVVIIYRTEIHHALVKLTSDATGTSTDQFGYDKAAWARWYNDEYLPQLAQRAEEAARIERAKLLERDAETTID